MKRFLLLFCTVALCFALFAVPAFATAYSSDQPLTIDIADGVGSSDSNLVLPADDYYLTVYIDGFAEPVVSQATFTVTDPTDMEEFSFDCSNGGSFVVKVSNNAYGMFYVSVEYLEDDCQVSGSTGYAVIRSASAPVVPEPPVKHPGSSSLSDILSVFTGIGSWIVSQLGTVSNLFWNTSTSSLTFLGVLSVSGLAFAVIFLLIAILQRFLHFRG